MCLSIILWFWMRAWIRTRKILQTDRWPNWRDSSTANAEGTDTWWPFCWIWSVNKISNILPAHEAGEKDRFSPMTVSILAAGKCNSAHIPSSCDRPTRCTQSDTQKTDTGTASTRKPHRKSPCWCRPRRNPPTFSSGSTWSAASVQKRSRTCTPSHRCTRSSTPAQCTKSDPRRCSGWSGSFASRQSAAPHASTRINWTASCNTFSLATAQTKRSRCSTVWTTKTDGRWLETASIPKSK